MERLRRLHSLIGLHPTIVDGVIAVVVCALIFLSTWLNWDSSPVSMRATIVLTLLVALPLFWRQRYPLAVLAFMTPAVTLFVHMGVPEGVWATNAWWFSLYSAGAYGQGRRRDVVRTVCVIILAALIVKKGILDDFYGLEVNRMLVSGILIFSNAVLVFVAWWFGDTVRIRREREQQLAERTVQLEAEREENARRAVLDERVRIARELHDVVAHHVSVMGVQAGAARRVLTKDPQSATEALTAIEATSRQAVLELHRLLGFLRQPDEPSALAPQPSLRELDDLVTQMREAGLPVEVCVEGEERTLPPGVDLSAYRIVQEALTNTLKHAGKAQTRVHIHYTEGALDLEVIDDGRSTAQEFAQERGGNGLIGMRERVSLLGGRLQTGYQPGIGFSVRAHLPLGKDAL